MFPIFHYLDNTFRDFISFLNSLFLEFQKGKEAGNLCLVYNFDPITNDLYWTIWQNGVPIFFLFTKAA